MVGQSMSSYILLSSFGPKACLVFEEVSLIYKMGGN